MQIVLQSTTKIVNINGVPARVWEGATENGIPVHCYITRIAVPEGRPAEDYATFERELKECSAPSAAVEAIPLWMIP